MSLYTKFAAVSNVMLRLLREQLLPKSCTGIDFEPAICIVVMVTLLPDLFRGIEVL